MSRGVKLLAALVEDQVGSGQNLMGAARTLTGAVSDLLRSVEPPAGEVQTQNSTVLSITSALFSIIQ
jgi:talin